MRKTATSKLFQAIYDNDLAAVTLCIENGAKLEHLELGSTPLMVAVNQGSYQLVKLLLDKGANVNTVCLDNGHTALLNAAIKGNVSVIELLIDRGANLERKDFANSFTALQFSADYGHIDAVLKLLDCGADQTAGDKHFATYIELAKSRNNQSMLNAVYSWHENQKLKMNIDQQDTKHGFSF